MHLFVLLHGLLWAFSIASPLPSSTSTAAAPASTVCGDIVNSCNYLLHATQAYECLTSVPFNAAVATRFLKYYNDTLQFQSTLAYLKHPPASYQQAAVDLIGGLGQIQQDIDNDAFPNQYAFEATLQNLIYSAHDSHLQLTSGILAAFSFASPYNIVSLSVDGIQDPKIYVVDDIRTLQGLEPQTTTDWTVSAIRMINGQPTTEYLSQIAATNAIGGLEPHADWNQLMSSSALDIQEEYSIMEGAITFYPGDTMTLVFENGTQRDPVPWRAFYISQGPTGPLATGGDFYNFFVLGLYPDSYDPNAPDPCNASAASSVSASTSASSSAAPVATATGWSDSAYPETADVVQPGLYPSGGGYLTGYFLKSISTAVLSIPTFSMSSDDAQNFSKTVAEFLSSSQKAGMTRVILDLQQNMGGDTMLAFDTFRQFFPSIVPFAGSRIRDHPAADVLGNTFTNTYSTNQSLGPSLYDALSDSEWVATDRLNAASGMNFTSWGEFYGPHLDNGDYFSTVQRDNLSSSIFDSEASGYEYNARPATNLTSPYPAENIVILSDGLCASTCALFVEMMHQEAGVQTVVIGGRPQNGPMQTAGGTRGARYYGFEDIDTDIGVAKIFNATTEMYLPDRVEDVWILQASINLRDQIRNGSSMPLQFSYEAANCRIFYTQETWSNYTSLWIYSATAIWFNSSMCVPGSTGHASAGIVTDTEGPLNNSTIMSSASAAYNITGVTATPNRFIVDFAGQEVDKAVQKAVKGTARPTVSNTFTQKCSGPNCGPKNAGGPKKAGGSRQSGTSFIQTFEHEAPQTAEGSHTVRGQRKD